MEQSALVRWIRANRWKTLGIVLVALFVLNVARLPFSDISELQRKNPMETAFMRAHAEEAERAGKQFRKRHRWVPLSAVSPHVVHAVVVAEDGSFFSHEGFDWYEIGESLKKNLREFRFARGGSTITQQLVKNLYLSASKNPLRKLNEWILTWHMERTLSKQRILEVYLNVIEWGDGMYGIESAAQAYFGKSAAGLTREEAARLAAIIPSPKRYRADSDGRYVTRRARLILSRMAARGY